MSGKPENTFPHDGEHGRSCTGYGCDCDEKNYGYHGGGSSGGGLGPIYVIVFLIALGIGAVNELLGALLIIVITVIWAICR